MPPHGQQMQQAPYGPTQIGGGIPPPMPQQPMGPYGQQPPQYPIQHRASTGSQHGIMGRPPHVSEMETNNRSKAQLIVGIDFVSSCVIGEM
jgi:hypothetical protein